MGEGPGKTDRYLQKMSSDLILEVMRVVETLRVSGKTEKYKGINSGEAVSAATTSPSYFNLITTTHGWIIGMVISHTERDISYSDPV